MPIFFLKKCEKLLHCKNFSHFFNQKMSVFVARLDKVQEDWTKSRKTGQSPGRAIVLPPALALASAPALAASVALAKC